jgi:hypothetical protein
MTGRPVSNPVLQLRVPETTLARIDGTRGDATRSAWVLRLIGRELNGQQPQVEEFLSGPLPLTLPDGEASPGTLCMGPGCFQRDTRTYGLRNLPLCSACAAALQGDVHQRQRPPGADKVIRRGAA